MCAPRPPADHSALSRVASCVADLLRGKPPGSLGLFGIGRKGRDLVEKAALLQCSKVTFLYGGYCRRRLDLAGEF